MKQKLTQKVKHGAQALALGGLVALGACGGGENNSSYFLKGNVESVRVIPGESKVTLKINSLEDPFYGRKIGTETNGYILLDHEIRRPVDEAYPIHPKSEIMLELTDGYEIFSGPDSVHINFSAEGKIAQYFFEE